MKLILSIALFIFILSAAPSKTFSQDISGDYSVGKTSCTIEYSGQVIKVYWRDGVGNTNLVYTQELPNGNIVYEEYDGNDYSGKFIFKSASFYSGIYERADGKRFNVRKR
jgi:hypothetical protein